MGVTYFDASALVKLVVQEPDSPAVDALWDATDVAVSSRLAHPEVAAAVAAAHRDHRLSDADLVEAEVGWQAIWSRVRKVELTDAVERHAGALAAEHALRGADAIHLAGALALGDPEVVVAVWDRRLHAACARAGLAVAPAQLP